MAQLLVFYTDHWFDNATTERQNVVNVEGKFNSRYIKGDVVQIEETSYWINTTTETVNKGWNSSKFVIIEVSDRTKSQLEDKCKKWERIFTYSLDLQDDTNGIYEYTITLTQESVSGTELFTVKDLFTDLPPELSILTKTSTQAEIRLSLPSEWTTTKKTEVRQDYQQKFKQDIKELSKLIAHSQHYIDLDSIPTAYKNKLDTDGWATGTFSQLQNYILNKKDE